MAGPVRARRLTDNEGRRLLQIVRRGNQGTIRVRRAMMIMASASGTPVPAIARLVAADADTVREVIHRFNAIGLACLDPRWAGGRPRRISDADKQFILAVAGRRPKTVGRPFTHWSLRKLSGYLAANPDRIVTVGRERLRQILHAHHISFQRTRTWKQSHDPDFDAKLDRIEEVTSRFPGPVFRLRPVRAAVDQAVPRHLLGTAPQTRPAAGHLPPHPRHPLLPRLLQPRRRPTLGRRPPAQRRRPHPGRIQDHP